MGARVRDRATGRDGTIASVATLHLDLVVVAYDATPDLRAERVWVEIGDLSVVR